MAGIVPGFSKLFLKAARPILVPIASSHVQPMRFPSVTYNDMTKPEGSWQEKYDSMNAEYSRYMYLGIISFALSLGITLYSLDILKYTDPPHKNTPEGLAFLNPKPEVLQEVLN
uniref:Deltameth_res domain-containing protein n=1 Tax=Mesocestoides corti TaxID=53468 RepID=A0A5K3EQH1_MESCO